MTVAHAAHNSAFRRALNAKVTVITHVPTDEALDIVVCSRMLAQGTIAVPTLTMMEGVVNNLKPPGRSYATARNSVQAMHTAGVTILAGTDSNMQKGVPANVMHGEDCAEEYCKRLNWISVEPKSGTCWKCKVAAGKIAGGNAYNGPSQQTSHTAGSGMQAGQGSTSHSSGTGGYATQPASTSYAAHSDYFPASQAVSRACGSGMHASQGSIS